MNIADLSAANVFQRGQVVGPAAVLGAHLHDALVFARGLHQHAALEHIVRKRLFDIDVLAGLAGHDRERGMPVVGRPDDDRIKVLRLEQVFDTFQLLRHLPVLMPSDGSGRTLQTTVEQVTHMRNLHVIAARKTGSKPSTTTATADQSQTDRLARASGRRNGGNGKRGRCCRSCAFQKPAAARADGDFFGKVIRGRVHYYRLTDPA